MFYRSIVHSKFLFLYKYFFYGNIYIKVYSVCSSLTKTKEKMVTHMHIDNCYINSFKLSHKINKINN